MKLLEAVALALIVSNHLVLPSAAHLRRVDNQADKRSLVRREPDPTKDLGTPDDLPPSVEKECDLYEGKAKGLCTAYCEAQDCLWDDDEETKKSCEKIRGKFLQETGETRMPCDPSRCPCWDRPEEWFDGTPVVFQWFFNRVLDG